MKFVAVLVVGFFNSVAFAGQFPSQILGTYDVLENTECSHQGHDYDPRECRISSDDGFYSASLELFQFTTEAGETVTSFVEALPYAHDQVNLQDFDATDTTGLRCFGKVEYLSLKGFKYVEGCSRPDRLNRTSTYEVSLDAQGGSYSNLIEGIDSRGPYKYLRRFKIARH